MQDINGLAAKGVSEVVRDAARLHEQLLQLRMDRGKLQREEVRWFEGDRGKLRRMEFECGRDERKTGGDKGAGD